MNHADVSTLDQVIPRLKELDDPRARRGRRYEWWVLLSTLVAAILVPRSAQSGIRMERPGKGLGTSVPALEPTA